MMEPGCTGHTEFAGCGRVRCFGSEATPRVRSVGLQLSHALRPISNEQSRQPRAPSRCALERAITVIELLRTPSGAQSHANAVLCSVIFLCPARLNSHATRLARARRAREQQRGGEGKDVI